MENNRISQGTSYGSYSIGEKKLLAEAVKKCKIDYGAEVERMKGKHIMIRSEKYMLLTSPYTDTLLMRYVQNVWQTLFPETRI